MTIKVTGMTADTAPSLDDLVMTVNNPGGTPGSRKVTISNLLVPYGVTFSSANQTLIITLGATSGDIPLVVYSSSIPLISIQKGTTGMGSIGIGTTAPTLSSTAAGGVHIAGNALRIATTRTPSAWTTAGSPGEICWGSSYLYVCSSAARWHRFVFTTSSW